MQNFYSGSDFKLYKLFYLEMDYMIILMNDYN
jgi:hypothetical protein